MQLHYIYARYYTCTMYVKFSIRTFDIDLPGLTPPLFSSTSLLYASQVPSVSNVQPTSERGACQLIQSHIVSSNNIHFQCY